MAIFSAPAGNGKSHEAPATRRGEQPSLSIIATGMRVTGEIESDGIVKLEGVVKGRIRAAQQVLIAKGGVIEGDIQTREAVIGGEVRGTIQAEERVEIQSTARVDGDIVTRRIAVVEGGQVNGEIRMGETALRVETGEAALEPAISHNS
ncbi:MAG TPA: polymer-forming cytoskeletal protein [Gemmatimonadales bacterium]|nr:polymer-forming cytoskeletal protein [Gemmatimonadales bacterium]